MYKMTSISRKLKENTFALIVPQKSFILIDNFKQYYFLYSDKDIEKCKLMYKSHYICEQNIPIHLAHVNGICEMNLFFQNTVSHGCETKMLTIENTIFLQLAKQNSWLYVAPKNEKLTISCRYSDTFVTLYEIGILTVEESCKAITKYLMLNSRSDFNSNISSEFLFNNVIHDIDLNFNDTFINLSPINVSSSSFSIAEQIENLNKISRGISLIKEKKHSLYSIKQNNVQFYSLYSVLVVLVLCFVAIRIYKKFCINCKSTTIADVVTVDDDAKNDNSSVQECAEAKNEEKSKPNPIPRSENRTNPRYNFRP